MQMIALLALGALGLGFMALNLAYWFFVGRYGEPRLRAHCERRFGVAIERGHRGTWRVVGSRPGHLGIELLQLVYFGAAFLVWGVLLVPIALAMSALGDLALAAVSTP